MSTDWAVTGDCRGHSRLRGVRVAISGTSSWTLRATGGHALVGADDDGATVEAEAVADGELRVNAAGGAGGNGAGAGGGLEAVAAGIDAGDGDGFVAGVLEGEGGLGGLLQRAGLEREGGGLPFEGADRERCQGEDENADGEMFHGEDEPNESMAQGKLKVTPAPSGLNAVRSAGSTKDPNPEEGSISGRS